MENHLSLIKTDFQELEKRIFPRFPFNYLTFKGEGDRVFAVKDISYSGMQLLLKNGGHNYRSGDLLKGTLNWRGATLDLQGLVKWVSGESLGIAFNEDGALEENVRCFLSIDNIISGMRPVHQGGFDLEFPSNLKYWLQADGPVEIFIWRHNDGEISRFQILMLGTFIEYEDGKGLKSGQVVNRKNLDTPLVQEDEFLLQMDEVVDKAILSFAQDIVAKLPGEHLPVEARDFLRVKLGLSTE